MRMQKRMLRRQARMLIAKIVIMIGLTVTYIHDPSSQLSNVALVVLFSMLTVWHIENIENWERTGYKG